MSAGADLDFLGNKARAGLLEIFHGLREIGDMDGDVMQPFTAFLHEFGDDRIGACGFQQLNAALAQRNHRHLDLLMRHGFFTQDFQPELLIKFARLRQRFDGDTEMVNGVGHDVSGSYAAFAGSWYLVLGTWYLVFGISCLGLPNTKY